MNSREGIRLTGVVLANEHVELAARLKRASLNAAESLDANRVELHAGLLSRQGDDPMPGSNCIAREEGRGARVAVPRSGSRSLGRWSLACGINPKVKVD